MAGTAHRRRDLVRVDLFCGFCPFASAAFDGARGRPPDLFRFVDADPLVLRLLGGRSAEGVLDRLTPRVRRWRGTVVLQPPGPLAGEAAPLLRPLLSRFLAGPAGDALPVRRIAVLGGTAP